jgi:purine catabolism regulator
VRGLQVSAEKLLPAPKARRNVKLREVLQLESLGDAVVVAGEAGLDREVRWAHAVDLPEPAPWVTSNQLLLTTGFAWPHEPEAEARLVRDLAGRGISAIGLAVPGYVDHFSGAAKEAAAALSLPLIEIPWEVPFARVTEELHASLLARQRATIERSEAIHRALTRAASEGMGLHDLARSLGELVARSVTIEDAEGRQLAHHSAHEHESGARVDCPIRLGGEIAGYVRIIEGEAPLSDLDHRAAEHAAVVAAMQIAHQRDLAQLESRLGYASFLSLLEAPSEVTPQAIERARLLGFDPDAPYRVAIAILDEPLPLTREAILRREHLTDRLRRQLVQCGVSRPMLSAMLNLVPFLLPESVPVDRVAAALDGEPARIVMGRAYSGTDGVRTSYREARSLVDYDAGERVARYEDILVPRVLLGDARARAAFIEQLLGPLDARRGGAALRDAVLAYADSGFRFKRTAERLGIHPNTLRYRLERAREATGLSLEDPEVRFRLQLANRLIALSISDAR